MFRFRTTTAAQEVDDTDAPAGWILADRAGNRVCVASWPDGSAPAQPAAPQ